MEKERFTIEQLLNDSSFTRWARGEADHTEAVRWEKWVQKNERNRRIAVQAQQKVVDFTFGDPELPDLREEWDKVRSDIEKNEQAMPLLQRKSASQNRDTLSIFFKVAAVFLIAAIVGWAGYMYQESASKKEQKVAVHTVQTSYGEKKTINLPDGSRIVLAAKSALSYKENWLHQPVKQVRLKGEAFFSIAPQQTKDHPKLVVQTEDGSAAVWGTKFTVDTYGKGTRVVLQEGDVRIQVAGKEAGTNNEFMISPGEMALFRQSVTKVEVKQVNPRVYTSWTGNELFFDNTPLSVLVRRIEQTYGVNVKVRDPAILQKKLSGSVDFRSLEELTQAVAEIFEIKIHQSRETLIVNQ